MTLNSEIQLDPERAAFLLSSRTLVVADVHLGKAATFRARGLPVPEGDSAHDLKRLLALIKKWNAAQLIIAGDFFHAPAGITPEIEAILRTFFEELPVPLILVSGNHDVKLRKFPHNLSLVPHVDFPKENIRIIHDPADCSEDYFHIAGHWHPAVNIRDGRNKSLRLPCFFLRKKTLVLPSFGSFTGSHIVSAQPTDHVFAALRDQVIEVPAALLS